MRIVPQRAFGVLGFLCGGAALAAGAPSAIIQRPSVPDPALLSGLPSEPWIHTPDTSRQYFPTFVSQTPRELVLGVPSHAAPRLPASLRKLASEQADKIRRTLGVPSVELLIWPTQDWNGQPNWVYARYRTSAKEPWRWLVDGQNWLPFWNQTVGQKPLLPQLRYPFDRDDQKVLFDDFLVSEDLYFQPQFGNCVYVDRATDKIELKWPHPDTQAKEQARLSAPLRFAAYCMNQPAREGQTPFALVLGVREGTLSWPDLEWHAEPLSPTMERVDQPLLTKPFAPDFEQRFRQDLRIFSGAERATFPITARVERFVKKGAFQRDHDLERLVDYLEERYQQLGIVTHRQRFGWRGIAQSNLIAKIRGRGSSSGKRLPIVVLADHIDTAVEEDTFERTGQRVTTPGADDNATATAVLLRAAESLQQLSLQHDVWLVHLTGEEFPADDLGAWRFAEKLMLDKTDLKAVVVSDFIGWHPAGSPTFQVNSGAHPPSAHFAALAMDASRKLAPALTPFHLPRSSERNAIYQTDVQVFEYLGFPGLLFNERINYSGKPSEQNPYNHTSSDTVAHIDIPFAAAIAKVMIETVARIADDK